MAEWLVLHQADGDMCQGEERGLSNIAWRRGCSIVHAISLCRATFSLWDMSIRQYIVRKPINQTKTVQFQRLPLGEYHHSRMTQKARGYLQPRAELNAT